jgi:hypothetical protein
MYEQDEMLDLLIEDVRPYGADDPVSIAISDGLIRAIGPDVRESAAGERVDAHAGGSSKRRFRPVSRGAIAAFRAKRHFRRFPTLASAS